MDGAADLDELLSMLRNTTPRARRDEISAIVKSEVLRGGPCCEDERSAIRCCTDHDVAVYLEDWVIAGAAGRTPERSYIISPSYPGTIGAFNIAHELGHLYLETSSEDEADCFASSMTGCDMMMGNLHAVEPAFAHACSIFARLQTDEHAYLQYVRERIHFLSGAGVSRRHLVDLIDDYDEVAHSAHSVVGAEILRRFRDDVLRP